MSNLEDRFYNFKKSIKFGFIVRISGIRFFKIWEFFYWLKKDISSFKNKIFKQ